jgi:hypothetical protein
MKFLTVQLPPFPRHLIPLRSKYSSQDRNTSTFKLYNSFVAWKTLREMWSDRVYENFEELT